MSSSSLEFKEFQVIEEHLFQEIELESIVKLQFNEETLKKNFEVLIKILKNLKLGVTRSNHKSLQNEKDINDLQKNNEGLHIELGELKNQKEGLVEQIKKLKDKQVEQQHEIKDLKEFSEKNKKQLEAQQSEIDRLQIDNKQNKADISQLREEIQKDNKVYLLVKFQILMVSNSLDNYLNLIIIQQQDKALQNILREIAEIKQNYVSHQEFSEKCDIFSGDIKWIKEELEELRIQLNETLKSLKKLSEDIDQGLNNMKISIDNKVDLELFDEQINYLKSIIQNLGSGKEISAPIIQGGLSAKETALLKALDKRVGELEEALRELRKDLNGLKENYKENTKTTNGRLDKIEALLDQFLKELNGISKLKEQLDGLNVIQKETQNKTQSNEVNIIELRKILEQQYEQMKNKKQKVITGGDSDLSEGLHKFKNEFLSLLQALRDELNDKASLSDLYKSEALILSKLDEVTGAIIKKCSDKQETKKALIYLEKKLFILIQEFKGDSGKEKPRGDDALIVRKPLLWSCISCDKGLDEYKGRLGDHKYWGVFPPKETTPERLGKFGKQFRVMQEKQLLKDKQFDQQNLSQSSTNFKKRFQHLPGQTESEMEFPNIHVKSM